MTNNLNVNIMIAVDLEIKTKKKEVKRKANNFKKSVESGCLLSWVQK